MNLNVFPWLILRVLSLIHLPVINMGLLLSPINLSYDWQTGSVPAIVTLYDVRNVFSFLFYLSIAVVALLGFYRNNVRFKFPTLLTRILFAAILTQLILIRSKFLRKLSCGVYWYWLFLWYRAPTFSTWWVLLWPNGFFTCQGIYLQVINYKWLLNRLLINNAHVSTWSLGFCLLVGYGMDKLLMFVNRDANGIIPAKCSRKRRRIGVTESSWRILATRLIYLCGAITSMSLLVKTLCRNIEWSSRDTLFTYYNITLNDRKIKFIC